MQSLTKCSQRQYVLPRNLFKSRFEYGWRKQPAHNLKYTTFVCNNEVLKQMHSELPLMSSALSRTDLRRTENLYKSKSIRYFSTTSAKAADKDSNSSKGSGNQSDKTPKKDEAVKAALQKLILYLFGVVVSISVMRLMIQRAQNDKDITTVVSWNEFVYQMLAKGEVKEIIVHPLGSYVQILLHDDAIIKGRRAVIRRYIMSVPNIEQFEERLKIVEDKLGIKPGEGVPVVYKRSDEYVMSITHLIIFLMICSFLYSMRKKFSMFKPFEFFSNIRRAQFTLIDPLTGQGKGVRFSDVAGLKEAKMEVMELVDYLKHPERYKTLGAKVPKGALLLGPPGCGKTLLAKAVATEANVPFLSMNGSEFIEVLGGLGAARVRDLFTQGKKRAPSIIYIDEIDAIGKKRSEYPAGYGNSESDSTLNQLLVEMDGMASRENVIILASTNRAEVLDKALLRPGRFDRHILIDLPTREERKQIFERHLKQISLKSKPEKYSGYLAYLTPGFSGADIANVCNEAALHAARLQKKVVDNSDLAYAIDRTIGGVTKKSSTVTASEKRIVAYHESGHALVGWLLEHTATLLKVTIVPRTNLKLGFSQQMELDQTLLSREQILENICMNLGGRVAESLTFNKITTGAQNDLKKITQMAYLLVQQYGMSEAVGLMSFDPEQTKPENKKPYSKKLANLMDIEVRRIIADSYHRTEKILTENRDKLEKLATALLEKETLQYEDVERLIGPPPFGKKRFVEPSDFEESIRQPKDTSIPQAEPA